MARSRVDVLPGESHGAGTGDSPDGKIEIPGLRRVPPVWSWKFTDPFPTNRFRLVLYQATFIVDRRKATCHDGSHRIKRNNGFGGVVRSSREMGIKMEKSTAVAGPNKPGEF